MKLGTLKSNLSFTKSISKQRPACGVIRVTKDSIEAFDLETYVVIHDTLELEPGYYDIKALGLVGPVSELKEPFPTNISSKLKEVEKVTLPIEQLFRCNEFSSRDETRRCLNGVAFDDGHIVAVDGHRMIKFETSKKLKNQYIFPRPSLTVLEKFAKSFKVKGDVTVRFGDDFAWVITDKFTLKARLIKREFPRWQTIVPKNYRMSVELKNMPSLKELKPLLSKRTSGIVLTAGCGVVTLTVGDQPKEKFSREVGVWHNQDEFRVGFNMEYLETALDGNTSGVLRINNELSACEVNGCIVMPLKV